MYNPSKTIRLIKLARVGDDSGLGELLESYRPLLSRLAQRQIGSQLRVRLSESDLVQETMLTASRGFAAFRGATEVEFRAWLMHVFESRLADGMRHHLVAERRRSDRERFDGEEQLCMDASSASKVASAEEESRMLLQAIMDLDLIDREIVLSRYVEQLTFEEIAIRKSMSLATVWRRWHRALEQIRHRLPVLSNQD